MDKKGYITGEDLLLGFMVGSVYYAFGSCTSHELTFSAETKSRSVKPVASKLMASALWDTKTVNKLSFSGSAEGLQLWEESELTYADLLNLWNSAKPIKIKAFERSAEAETEVKYYKATVTGDSISWTPVTDTTNLTVKDTITASTTPSTALPTETSKISGVETDDVYGVSATVEPKAYLIGDVLLTSVKQSAPAGDDVTISVQFESANVPDTFDTSKITVGNHVTA